MSDTLIWDYAPNGKPGDLFYPMNGTGNLDEEGYGQLLPVAAAENAGSGSVTIMPASAYNAANSREVEDVEKTLTRGLAYDERKAEFIERYFGGTDLELSAISSQKIMEEENLWSYLSDALRNNSQTRIRANSPLPDWMADKSVDSYFFLEAASSKFPVTEEVFENAQGYNAADLYLPLHSAEAQVAEDLGMDAKLGISSEEPFDEFTYQEAGFPSFRSAQPLGISGEEVVPYAERSDPEDQILLSDSPTEVAEKLDGADIEAAKQVEDIARELEDDIMSEARKDA